MSIHARQKNAKHSDRLHVGITGGFVGDVLQSTIDDTRLEVTSGRVAAPAVFMEALMAKLSEGDSDEEHANTKLAKLTSDQFRCSTSVARLKMKLFPVEDVPNHQPLGGCMHGIAQQCECATIATFRILSQGKWQQHAEAEGKGAELEDMVTSGRDVTWRDILNLFYTRGKKGCKTLSLRPDVWYNVGKSACELSEDDPLVCSSQTVDAVLGVNGGGTIVSVQGHLIRVAPSGPSLVELGAKGVLNACVGCMSLESPLSQKDLDESFVQTEGMSAGVLKSYLQKLIRFRAGSVESPEISVVDARAMVVVVLCRLCALAGSFSPELQLFTRGCTAALKRLAVIAVEDSWVDAPSTPSIITALLGVAVVSKYMASYHPPVSMVAAVCEFAIALGQSPLVLAWRRPASVSEKKVEMRVGCLEQAAILLREAGSFRCDIEMLSGVAECTAGCYTVETADGDLSVMESCHLIDQHCVRGVGHVYASKKPISFADVYDKIFKCCTGLNPRFDDVALLSQKREFLKVRAAQRTCWPFVIGEVVRETAQSDEVVRVCAVVDPGELAAAVGPVTLQVGKQSVRFILSPAGEDEKTMLPPSRDSRDLFDGVSEATRRRAIQLGRSQRLPVRSACLPGVSFAHFENGEWYADGVPWSEYVANGQTVETVWVPDPEWLSVEAFQRPTIHVDNVDLLYGGIGMCANSMECVTRLAACVPDAARRAAALLHQQSSVVRLPMPSITGEIGFDQLKAYTIDRVVWQLLALISRVVPAAFTSVCPPHFKINNALLTKEIRGWLLDGTSHRKSVGSPWSSLPEWQVFRDGADEWLMPHQQAAVAEMTAKKGNHFLVMDTGTGKTLTALLYGYRWLCENDGCCLLWITPKGTVENLGIQLSDKWKVPVWNVPRVSTAAKCKRGETRGLELHAHCVNVMHADHLRTAIEHGLVQAAGKCFVVFDEVDECYNNTLRTSAALRLSQLCPKFVAQTATPMRKTENQLIQWLKNTCSFEVSYSNYLVAASQMVSMQLDLGILSDECLELLTMSDALRGFCMSSHGDWQAVAKRVQSEVDMHMTTIAVRLAKEDRTMHSDGGVLLVANTLDHAAQLMQLCAGKCKVGGFDTLGAGDAAAYEVVVVSKQYDRGYNSAVRLGAMVTGVYPGNASARHQIRGRIRRYGQKRDMVHFVTVTIEHSILHLLHERHSSVDTMNMSLEQLGERFSKEMYERLN